MEDTQLLRYSRQIMLPSIGIEGQEKLLNARVLIIGLGGLGSPVSQYLCAAGVGTLGLNDFDQIELTNLQRQINYQTADIGKQKLTASVQRLSALNPEITLLQYAEKFTDDSLLACIENYDLILDCTDNYAARFMINRVSVKSKTPLVSGAAIKFDGQVICFRPDLAGQPCYHCLYEETEELAQTCSDTGVMGPLLGIIGSLQAFEAMKILLQLSAPQKTKLHIFDGLRSEWRAIGLNKDTACCVCNKK